MGVERTLVELKTGDGLPFIGRDEPFVVFSATGEVDDEFGLVVIEGGVDGLESVHGEGGVREEVRCYDHLLRSISLFLPRLSSALPAISPPRGSTHFLSTPLNPLPRILLRNATTNLHTAFPRVQCFFCRLIITRA